MMNRLDIVRAWKDEEYRRSLTEAQRAALPQNPAGLIELEVGDLGGAAGGNLRKGYTASLQFGHVIRPSVRIVCPPRTIPGQCPPVTAAPRCPLNTMAINCPRLTVNCPS
jgi:mersacidin/lichenicidin family type 2 lantibiotic